MMFRGFTIVELLIVIVVIAILAAITLVAYNGITTRASNTQVTSGTQEYYDALLQYDAINGSYPVNYGCLGTYPAGQCWQGASGTYNTNPALTANLATVMSSQPTLTTSLHLIGAGQGDNYRGGAVYRGGTGIIPTIVYYLQGVDQNCSVANSTAVDEGGLVTQCTITLP